MDEVSVQLTVNGQHRQAAVEARVTLADFLREQCHLTGTHLGCEHGVCGACTVLLDGEPIRACLMLAVQGNGREVGTIEGLAPSEDELHPLQEAFWAKHGLQCGYCTPGIIMSACAFLKERPAPTDGEIREMLAGHLCRCTGYHFIVEAIAEAARALAGSGPALSSDGPQTMA
jgi:aerobic carbon-monoxide dehydrogenase small subunit